MRSSSNVVPFQVQPSLQCEALPGILPRLAFVHVPKTAGTAITSVLLQAYGKLALPAMTTLDYPRYDDGALARFRLYRGHSYRRDYRRLPADTRFLTVLRDPVDRAMSIYAYSRAIDPAHVTDPFVRESVELARTVSPIEFVYADSPCVIEHVRLGQMRQFISPETGAMIAHRQFLTRGLRQAALDEFVAEMRRFDFVLTSESLALTFPLVAAALGLPESCHVLGRENAAPPVAAVDRTDLRRALIDVNSVEFEAYAYVQRMQWRFLEDRAGLRAPGSPGHPDCDRE